MDIHEHLFTDFEKCIAHNCTSKDDFEERDESFCHLISLVLQTFCERSIEFPHLVC